MIAQGNAPEVQDPVSRIARLLALAWKWEGMVRRAEVKDYAELARRYDLSRARVAQICNLSLLSTRMQDHLLFSPSSKSDLGSSRALWS